MSENEFQCLACKGFFTKTQTDEEAIAQKDEDFPEVPMEECGLICDDCYQILMVGHRPAK